jgi:DNA mismatch repair protein MutS
MVETPLMKQYISIKTKHPDAILLFRVGDFYETFGEDAIKASGILGITLTHRANGSAQFVELAGFPYHALDTYLPKLVRAGQRVAICEQLENPALVKGIVKRGIIEMVTPGVSINDNIVSGKENQFLACVHFDKNAAGVAFLDITTGEFLLAEGNLEYIDKLLSGFQPKEVLLEKSHQNDFAEAFGTKYYTYKLDDWVFTHETAEERLLKQFQASTLKGFGIQNYTLATVAAGAILQYLEMTSHTSLGHISSISRIEEDHYVWLDKFTVRNLELFHSPNDGAKTLIDVLDKTHTPMGGRTMRRWLSLPLKEEKPINARLDVVEYLINQPDVAEALASHLKYIGDLERMVSKIAFARINPRELIQLKNALNAIIPIRECCQQSNVQSLKHISEQLNPCLSLIERIEKEISADPPVQIVKGGVIAAGVSAELDELRDIQTHGKDFLLHIQQREIERTGITSLKISYNNVFGYYIEVRNTHKDKVPSEWIRKQTLVNAERYITAELKEYEDKILGAEQKIMELETTLYNALVSDLAEYIPVLQLNASLIGKIDVLLSFATVSLENKYCRPQLDGSNVLDIKEGRHPVIEKQLARDQEYVANDLFLDSKSQQIIILTGPNMSGKSALLRQTALIVIMAQIGCFVSAQEARIGLVDKVFTRVGASDNISAGESTFMVEMTESASILNNLSSQSLVLLDEIGRGTSTYDGISIAWSMAEYIHEHTQHQARTLFATHYHELNEMEKSFARIKNFKISVREVGNKVIFLRKLVVGASEHSFGIHVARMAGMPKSVVQRAEEILTQLESNSKDESSLARPVKELGTKREGMQLSFFQLDDPVLKKIRDEIKTLDIDSLTPIAALNKLNEIKKIAGL